MKNTIQLLVTSLSFFIFIGCTKQSVAPAREGTTSQTSNTKSITFNDITINASQAHVFSVPAITEAIVNSGTISVYATTNTSNSSMPTNNSSMTASNSSMQWEPLSTIYGCSNLHVDIAVGQLTMQNNTGNNVTTSFRFDITGN